MILKKMPIFILPLYLAAAITLLPQSSLNAANEELLPGIDDQGRLILIDKAPAKIDDSTPVDRTTYHGEKYLEVLYKGRIHDTWIDLNSNNQKDPYEDTALSIDDRVEDLLSRMTVNEKLDHRAPKPHLGIPEYAYWLEAEHGVCFSADITPNFVINETTVFPINMAFGATWNTDLVKSSYSAIGDEARALFNIAEKTGDLRSPPIRSLNFFSPAIIGVMRDCRWLRAEEGFGEDPYLVSRIAVSCFQGFQGVDDGVPYMKVTATAKHFPSNMGPLGVAFRMGPNPHEIPTERLSREIAFPPYQASIQEGQVMQIMTGISTLPPENHGRSTAGSWNGKSSNYMKDILDIPYNEWGFKGLMIHDCMGLPNSWQAFIAGNDTICGGNWDQDTHKAVEEGKVPMEVVDRAARRVLRERFMLGLFDPPNMVPYSNIGPEVVNCPEHIKLARQVAEESIVLLKNDNNLLPLAKKHNSIAVIGAAAFGEGPRGQLDIFRPNHRFGGYCGDNSKYISPYLGIYGKVDNQTTYVNPVQGKATEIIDRAKEVAGRSKVAIVFVGPPKEGEEHGERRDLSLPEGQLDLLKAVKSTGIPTIAVLIGGTPLSSEWMKNNIDAILVGWYPGQEAGTALSDVIFGDYNPSGHLPVTYAKAENEPLYYNHKDEIEYSPETYLWPFGYGLSYTTFNYSNLRIVPQKAKVGQEVQVYVDVTNTGKTAGADVVQLYLNDMKASVKTPALELKEFAKITLQPGEKKIVSFKLVPYQFSLLNENLERVVEPGDFNIMIGQSSEDISLEKQITLSGKKPLKLANDCKMFVSK